MSSPCHDARRGLHGPLRQGLSSALCGALALGLACVSGCEREKRDFSPPQGAASQPAMRQTTLQPGDSAPVSALGAPSMPTTPYTIETNAYSVAQGKRLYNWFNCSGCHAPGGGGEWGPALSDDKWLYGSGPEDIFVSIVQGRPQGMPSFGGHISEDQVWQIVAYVRSLSGQLRSDVAPGRADSIQTREPESRRPTEAPKPMERNDGTTKP